MKRLIVTGASGFVGGNVVIEAGRAAPPCEVHAVSRRAAPSAPSGARWHSMDPLDENQLRQLFDEARPDAVIHAAAIADIDYCQTHPEEARRVNVELTRTVAGLSAAAGAKLVFVSTDTIFDGARGGYREEDAPGPVNVYAETKVEAERIVASSPGAWVIARLSLVMGLPAFGAGNAFLPRMIQSLEEGRRYGVPADEIRSPIDVVTAARALLELAIGDLAGCFHLAGNDRLTRHEMARLITARLGFNPNLIFAQDGALPTARAPRPRDVSLDNAKARRLLKTPMLGLEEGLELAVQETRKYGSKGS